MCREVKCPAPTEQQWECLILQALHLETGSWLIHLLWMCLLYEEMAGGCCGVTIGFTELYSRRDAHPVPCELHSFAEYGITLAWIHACRGSSHGESILVFPKMKCWLEEVGSPFWKALQRVGIFFPWVNSDPSKHQIYSKSKGVQTFLSPDLQLPHAFACWPVKYLQRPSFKKKNSLRAQTQAWVSSRAWALHTATLLDMSIHYENWPAQNSITTVHRLVLWSWTRQKCGSFWQQSCQFITLQSWGTWVAMV